jgi:hypothetical protein
MARDCCDQNIKLDGALWCFKKAILRWTFLYSNLSKHLHAHFSTRFSWFSISLSYLFHFPANFPRVQYLETIHSFFISRKGILQLYVQRLLRLLHTQKSLNLDLQYLHLRRFFVVVHPVVFRMHYLWMRNRSLLFHRSFLDSYVLYMEQKVSGRKSEYYLWIFDEK